MSWGRTGKQTRAKLKSPGSRHQGPSPSRHGAPHLSISNDPHSEHARTHRPDVHRLLCMFWRWLISLFWQWSTCGQIRSHDYLLCRGLSTALFNLGLSHTSISTFTVHGHRCSPFAVRLCIHTTNSLQQTGGTSSRLKCMETVLYRVQHAWKSRTLFYSKWTVRSCHAEHVCGVNGVICWHEFEMKTDQDRIRTFSAQMRWEWAAWITHYSVDFQRKSLNSDCLNWW